MNTRMMKSIAGALVLSTLLFSACTAWAGKILVGKDAPALEQYAARELQRYLYFVSGTKLEIRNGASHAGPGDFVLKQDKAVPGPQGYSLKKAGATVTIAGSDSEGVLYGVYGLLQDHYGVGFYLGGDVLPEGKKPLMPATLDETKKPTMTIRGFLPWTNFPQSATSYSWEDWKFIIDQAAKMRMNFILVHNYNGEGGHNEPFHNFEWQWQWSRVFMPTAKTGHGWFCPGWDVNQYRFGAADLFDDYDFGSDCGLHNESLDNLQVFRKGVSLFQKVIAYAHTRGVKIGLGLDINLVPGLGWGWHGEKHPAKVNANPADPAVIAARTRQLADDYPDLDYLFCFQSEGVARNAEKLKEWQTIFAGFYRELKRHAPHTRLAVSGWGIQAWTVADCPPDVICAPIAHYSAKFDSGAGYGNREYWSCPWLEKDGNSSQYYYPYFNHLSDTIKSWNERAPNMKGFHCLTWRITDAIDPKMSYISSAPWDDAGRYATSEAVYHDYAERNYGAAAAKAITDIINQREPFATSFAECIQTPYFTMAARNGRAFGKEFRNVGVGKMDQHAMAVDQLKVIDKCIAAATPAQAERLNHLRCRIAAVRDHILLNHRFNDRKFTGQADLMQSWVRNFTHRVTDISSLGNIMSTQNRFVLENYLPKEKTFRPAKPVDAPLHPVVISPPTSVPAGQTATVKVRVLDSRSHEAVTATLHWRVAGEGQWNIVPMARRVKAIFVGSMPAAGLVEYYIAIAEGDRTARYPVEGSLSFVTTGTPATPPATPANLRVENQALIWNAVPGAFWYRIYRDDKFLTYVAADTLTFKDAAPGFDGRPLTGPHTYRITAADIADNESRHSDSVTMVYH